MIKKYSSLAEAHKDIFDRNWNSYFSRIAKRYHLGAPVELGIFFYFQGKIYPISKPWNDENIYKREDGWRSYDQIHEDGWQALLKQYPELPKENWQYCPRGRIYFNGRLFVVESDLDLKDVLNFKSLVISKFNLPPEGSGDSDNRATKFMFTSFYTNTGNSKIWGNLCED